MISKTSNTGTYPFSLLKGFHLPLLFLIASATLSPFHLFSQVNTELDLLYQRELNSAEKRIFFQPNSKTGNYDVSHYKMEFEIDPNVKYIKGIISPTFTVTKDLDVLHLDFAEGMAINSITHNGDTLLYTQSDYDLIIIFPELHIAGEEMTISIDYEGRPSSVAFGTFEQGYHSSSPIIWTLSEPYGAMEWWPCKQDLKDKADSIDIFITTPEQYSSVTNGIVVDKWTQNGMTTTHWAHKYPIPAYLVGVAVSNYVEHIQEFDYNGIQFPIINYIYPEDSAIVAPRVEVTIPIMEVFSDLFEPYPYHTEKYGHCQFNWGGGMEHTTISFMGGFSRDLIAHELAHQWFGDKVTCASWQDIWLNEGFAGYLTGLIYEHLDDPETFQAWRAREINIITGQPDGSVYVPAKDTLDVNRVFLSRLTYSKGSMVLHMLRKRIGDDAFYNGLRAYLQDPELAYAAAYTHDLRRHLEDASGQDLEKFFNDWIYREGFPFYQLRWSQDETNKLKFSLNQSQTHKSVDFFDLHVKLRFIGTGNEILDETFYNDENGQNFSISVPFPVHEIIIDPDKDLITNHNEVIVSSSNPILEDKVHIFPTPADNYIVVSGLTESQNWKYRIYDSSGRIVKQQKLTSDNKINLEEIMQGVYYIRFNSTQGELVKKLIVK